MFNNTFQILESFGFLSQHRSVYLQFSDASLNSQVFLQRIDGQHYLNQGMTAELICLSTNAHIPLKTFIGVQVAVDQITDRGSFFRTTGIITGASQGQSDGALTLYKLAISDPTYLWHKRRNSRVFMNKSVKEISEILFQEWQAKSPLFASSLTLDLSGLKQTYDVRPFVMQLNESDYDFLTRLWRSEGISWLIDEAELTVASNTDDIQPQKLRLIDDNNQYEALTRRAIRYHRSSATEQSDSMTSLMADRSLQPTSVFVQRWQSDVLQQTDGAGSVQSKHQHSSNYDNQSLSLEEAWHYSPAWMQDLNGEDGATSASNQQLEKFNQNLSAYYDAQSKQFIAKTTVRDTQVGYWFELNEHPEIDQHNGADKEFLIVGKNYYNQNNLPKDLNQQIQTLVQQSDWQASNTDERQANQLILQRRHIPTTPAYNPQTHSPATHPQRAKVVGPEGEEIYVDEWGRIKVRFLFTRSDDHSHDGGAGTNNNDTDSAWIDVLTPWAGEGYGARFLPRIGEIVVINFFNGDIDRPFVMGRVHEAQRHPTKFDNKGKLPDTKKLSGIRSKEVSGGGFGQLRFDDTPGQISTQLQSSHGASQLNLGKLSHPKDKAESEDRGEGFELRTDQWGALRAGQGLLVSTYKQDNAKGEHLDAEVAKKQLEGSQTNSKALSDIAKNQKTDEIESIEQLKDFASQIQQQIAKFEKALLLLSSPDGIALSTSEDIHISADAQINQVAGDSINISTQKNVIAHAQNKISLFAAQSGLKAVAAQGKVEIQAQADALDVLSKLGITISSTDDKVIISSPKEVKITGGSSQITLNGSGIFPKTGGKFQVNAGQHLFMGGASANASAPELPKAKPMQGALELLRSYGGDNFFKQNSYKVIDSLGKQITGKLDGNGFAQVTGIAPGPAKVVFEKDNTSAWLQSSDFNRKYTWAEPVKSVQGLMKNALEAVGQNTMSQLQNNLLSTDKNSFKNLGKNTLDNLAGQALGQIKNQVTNTALNTVSKQLNLNLSADQMKSLGQMAVNPSQSLEMLKEQSQGFLTDQMTAKLSKSINQDSPIQQGALDNFIRSKK
ncbi:MULTISPECIES: type VI secretion system Vgr family protein [Acinetobacter calcoaceticus/baumannii complex]|uniref:type VI secretion system Vgr family protein n=1 Tax=Acinetobacter calcoaceticus/baumannii complex TaxID=909768 RepID=UPI00044F51AA|nr:MULTISPECIES: type VI secretion system tip protein TssI/VgrG [Acinetobacter calcoaceticus/baumannii complex]SSR41345.1 Rhs element Vgr protein [Acinetobacter baumannii]EXR32893.1 rhs element Vgr family protein [Acinetobacter sp. 1179249]MBJ8464866.1 type VI secretion system tip protein VgrG [Acinetobacter nosocomialis]MBP1496447.1 type VI secretion system tip protein VgrG [Acinetobacter nosocomialis]MBR7692058.1 type VI secretion system tip protein VgrG [Acinetobacter nosocomialis]